MKLYEIFFNKILNLFSKKDLKSIEKEVLKKDNSFPINVGSVLKIDTIDTKSIRFNVLEVCENEVSLGGKFNKFKDYILSGDQDNLKLRFFKDLKGRERFILLKQHDALEYDEGFHDLVKNSQEFEMHDDLNDDDEKNDIHEKFWRVNDVKISYKTKVKILDSEQLVSNKSYEYLDFSRITKVDSVEVEEFVFVEMDTETGMFVIWRGMEIPSGRIVAF